MNLSITSTTNDTAVVIAVAGEVDVSNASELREAIDAQAATNPARIEVDLARVAYIDSTGIGVLVGAAHAAQQASYEFAVAHPQPNVKRVLGMLGVEKDLHIEE